MLVSKNELGVSPPWFSDSVCVGLVFLKCLVEITDEDICVWSLSCLILVGFKFDFKVGRF